MGSRADRIVPIFITVDPKRDKPEILKAYLDAFGARWVWGAASVVYLLGALLTVVLAPRRLEAEEALA